MFLSEGPSSLESEILLQQTLSSERWSPYVRLSGAIFAIEMLYTRTLDFHGPRKIRDTNVG